MNAAEALTDSHRFQLQTWLHGREGVEAGRTLPVAIEELEKPVKEQGGSDKINTLGAWLISATGTGP